MKRILLSALIAATGWAGAQPARPGTHWYGKVFTTERSRQVYVGLHADLWLLYDLPHAALYRAWKGGAAGGALATATADLTPGYWFKGGSHFPHLFVPAGTDHFKDSVGEYFASYTKPADIDLYYTKWPRQPRAYKAWTVLDPAGKDAGAGLRYRGYSVRGNVFTLKFGLLLPGGGEIAVTESPEYSAAGGRTTLARTFTFAGIPAGHQVKLLKPGSKGGWAVTSGTATFASGAMTQAADGTSVLTGGW